MSAQSQIFNPTLRTSQASGEGFSCPAMNTASRLSIVFGPSDRGMMVYDTDLSNVMLWTGAVWVALGIGVTPLGPSLNTQIIYNNAGVLEGDAGLVYNNVTDGITVSGNSTISAMTVGKGGTNTNTTNTAVGNGASRLLNTTTNLPIYTTSLGINANQGLTNGNYNTAIGAQALNVNSVGSENTAVGYNTLSVSSGSYNTATGSHASYQAVAAFCTYNGAYAGSSHLSGDNCGFFGYAAQGSTTTIANEYTYGNTSVLNHRFANGNLVVASARGIDFSATAGAGTSELLDDYEEGTWTPTDASGAGLAIVGTGCVYTKIGRVVTIEGFILFPANASAADAAITGLPFNNANILGLNPQYGSETTLVSLYGGPTSTIALYTISLTPITNATMSNDSFLLSGTYTAAT